MKCEEAELRMAELLAGEVARVTREALEAHLLDCATCRADFELARAGARVEWPYTPVPPALAKATLALFRGEPRVVRFFRFGTAAAAAFCVALLVALSGSKPTPPPAAVAPTATPREALAFVQDAGVGSLVARDEEGRPVGELGLKSHHVSVEILDGVAKTTVEENFQNHTDRRLEGTFHFPLPPDASIFRLALEVNGKIEEGTCLERERAREVFESIVRKMQDPALLEWMSGGIFKCRVFPIEPRATKRVIVGYTQALPFFRGRTTYVYPLASEKTRTHPPEEVRIDVRARYSGTLSKIESSSHRVDVRRRDAHEATATFAATNLRPENDFVLSLETADDELRVVPHKVDGEDGYFALFVTPRGEPARAPGKYVFLLDISASVSGPELEVAKRLVRAMMEKGMAGDRFEVAAHHVDVESSGEVDLRGANAFMERLRPMGACDLLKALRSAPEGEIIYIGEGTPTFGESDPAKILEGARGRRIRTVGVGSDANVELLAKLGGHFRVNPNDDVPRRVAEIAATLGSPVISDLRVEGGQAVYDLVGVRDVFYGERLLVTGRYRGTSTKLVVTGGGYGRDLDVTFPEKEEGNNYVRRLWAQRKVSDLLARGGAQAEVTALGVKHQIMTPYTSFLVLETEQMWKDYQLKREVQKQDEVLGKKKEGGVGTDEDPDMLAIHRKLDTMKIDLSFENAKVEDVLAYIREFSGLNIVLDAAVQQSVDPNKTVTFKARDLVVKNSLKLLLAQLGLDYRVTPERVVLLTDPKKAAAPERVGVEDSFGDLVRSKLQEATDLYKRGRVDEASSKFEEAFQMKPSSDQVYAYIKRVGDDLVAGMMNSPDRRVQDTGRRLFELAKPGEPLREGKEVVRKYVEELKSDDHATWRNSFWHLKNFGPHAVKDLIPALGDNGNDRYRARVILLLTEIGVNASPAVAEALNSRDPFVRQNAAITLGNIKDARSLPALARLAEDPNESPDVKKFAREALGKIDRTKEDARAKAIREAYEEQVRRERQLVTITKRNASVPEVVDELRRQTGWDLLMDPQNIPADAKVDEFVVQNGSPSQALAAFAAKAGLEVEQLSPTAYRLARPTPGPVEPTPPPVVKPPAPQEQNPVSIQASTAEFEKIARELARGRTVQEQQQAAISQQHYELARLHHSKGEFEKAKTEAQKAVQSWHENLAARRLLQDIQLLTVGGRAELGARSTAEPAMQDFRTRFEQAQLEITKHIRDGERFLRAGLYDDAVKSFENAEFKITSVPYDVKAMNDLLPGTRESIVRARNAKLIADRRLEEEKKKVAEVEAGPRDVDGGIRSRMAEVERTLGESFQRLTDIQRRELSVARETEGLAGDGPVRLERSFRQIRTPTNQFGGLDLRIDEPTNQIGPGFTTNESARVGAHDRLAEALNPSFAVEWAGYVPLHTQGGVARAAQDGRMHGHFTLDHEQRLGLHDIRDILPGIFSLTTNSAVPGGPVTDPLPVDSDVSTLAVRLDRDNSSKRRPKGIAELDEDLRPTVAEQYERELYFSDFARFEADNYRLMTRHLNLKRAQLEGQGVESREKLAEIIALQNELKESQDRANLEIRRSMDTQVLPLKHIQPPSTYTAKVEEGKTIGGRPIQSPAQIEDILKRYELKQVLESQLSRTPDGRPLGKLDFDPLTNSFIVRDTQEVRGRIGRIVAMADQQGQKMAAVGKKLLEEKLDGLHQWGYTTDVAPKKPLEAKVAAVTGDQAIISIGKDDGVLEGDEFTIYHGGDFVARLVIDRSDRRWSAGKVTAKVRDPRVDDDVCNHMFVLSKIDEELARRRAELGRQGLDLTVTVVTDASARGDAILGTAAGIAAGHLMAVTRDDRFVALVAIHEVGGDRAKATVWRGIAAGRVLPGDRARRVTDVRTYLAGLPEDVRKEIDSRAGIETIRAKMGIKP